MFFYAKTCIIIFTSLIIYDLSYCNTNSTYRAMKWLNKKTDGKYTLKEVRKLKILFLRNINLTQKDFKILVTLSDLRELYLDHCGLDDKKLHYLLKFRHVKQLSVARNRKITSEGLKYISQLKELEFLDLTYTGIGNSGLKKLKKLNYLILAALDFIDDNSLEYLLPLKHSLKNVAIDSEKITDIGLKTLSKLDNLEYLSLRFSKITNNGLKHLLKLKNLKTLDIGHTMISDEGLKIISKFTKLEFLELVATKITDKGLDSLTKLKNLKILYLNMTKITDKGLLILVKMKNLKYINAYHTKTTKTMRDKLRKKFIKIEFYP